MKKFIAIPLILSLAACAMTPEQIDAEVSECQAYDDLVPVVIVGKRGGVKKVTCTIDEESGITVIERSLLKLVVPPLPEIPKPDFPTRPE